MGTEAMFVVFLLVVGTASSVLFDANADIADIRNLTEWQTLAINTLSDGLVTTNKLITSLHLGINLLK